MVVSPVWAEEIPVDGPQSPPFVRISGQTLHSTSKTPAELIGETSCGIMFGKQIEVR